MLVMYYVLSISQDLAVSNFFSVGNLVQLKVQFINVSLEILSQTFEPLCVVSFRMSL